MRAAARSRTAALVSISRAGYKASRATGHDMQRGPPRPVPNSAAAIGSTSMPASRRRALVSVLRS